MMADQSQVTVFQYLAELERKYVAVPKYETISYFNSLLHFPVQKVEVTGSYRKGSYDIKIYVPGVHIDDLKKLTANSEGLTDLEVRNDAKEAFRISLNVRGKVGF